MKTLGYLLLITFMFSIGHASYSINEILDYIQENNQYEIIHLIKCYLGDDVAIDIVNNLLRVRIVM